MTFEESYNFLLGLPKFDKTGADAMNAGQDRVLALLDRMGDPHLEYPAIHVAGTNGKGSTSSMTAAILTASGRKVGLHTSPHLVSVNERMRVDGVPASKEWFAKNVLRYRDDIVETGPSFFEATTALSLLHFAEQGVHAAVIEVGLGGRLDATNVLRSRLCLITSIGFDHTDLLGDTLSAIAAEKAGIIKRGVPVITSNEDGEVLGVLSRVARERGAKLFLLKEYFDSYRCAPSEGGLLLSAQSPRAHYRDEFVGLAGAHQLHNALLSIAGTELLGVDNSAVREGLKRVAELSGIRGRLQVLRRKPWIIADVGHNADGFRASSAFVQQLVPPGGTVHLAIGLMRDKNMPEIIGTLRSFVGNVYPIRVDSPRAVSADELAAATTAAGIPTAEPLSVPEAIEQFSGVAGSSDVLLVAGSHQVVAPVLEFMESDL